MKIDGIDIQQTVASLKTQIEEDKTLSPSLRAAFELLLLIVTLLSNRLGLNSQNSSKPPSTDPNRTKASKAKEGKKPGGQNGHSGKTLNQFTTPDEIELLLLDPASLPQGTYTDAGVEKRQVVDLEFRRVVTEYQAQVLVNEQGKRFVADFPEGVTRPIQYGAGLKAHAVYLSQYQLLPYDRIGEYFADQLGLPLSSGSLYNFITEAYAKLESTQALNKISTALISEPVLHSDETGININGTRHWLHNASSTKWTLFTAHAKRGKEAMDDAGVLPFYQGILCHDHWKPYFSYGCAHVLCNAHHLRELERAYEQDGQQWAQEMMVFLRDTLHCTKLAGGKLSEPELTQRKEQYRAILKRGDVESPPPDKVEGQKGRPKKSKARNLLERLRDFEIQTLRFMEEEQVPFTNNQGENDIRMTKVHQKISGCFRSEDGAKMFCALRSYLSSCRKQDVSASSALNLLFTNHLPDIFGQKC
jgi:transposase